MEPFIMSIIVETGTIIGITGVIVGIISLCIAYFRYNKEVVDEVKKQENRITKLEQTQFTIEDRKCLQDVSFKIGLVWSVIEKDFPKLLQKESSPKLDILLQKIDVCGFPSLMTEERVDLVKQLYEEYFKALKIENEGHAMRLSLYIRYVEGVDALQKINCVTG